jgi:predicted ABC-class ATPase
VNCDDLRASLLRLEGRGYPAYKDLRGRYDFGDFCLELVRVQGDPFAGPSRLGVRVEGDVAGFPRALYSSRVRRIALGDYVARRFALLAQRCSRSRGSGKSGRLKMERPGQQVLEQSAVMVGEDGALELRFTAGLPARGRRIAGREAEAMLCDDLSELVAATAYYESQDAAELELHVQTVEDSCALRDQLTEHGLVAFVANASVLPRESGVDDRPLGDGVVEFVSPASLEVELTTPNAGVLRGMGLATGVTVITGGGYHGKSTLLRALEYGVYDHLPGDGRERVVALGSAVKIRAEDGRSVAGVDISPFISDLPGGRCTRSFFTDNASGSTSQAANIIEALEAGASLLLIDEDSSATNFMIRDRRMQELVAKEHEPITPFVDRVRQLCEQHAVSSVIVIGGSGDYLDVADKVVGMRDYRALDLTAEAREVAARFESGRRFEALNGFEAPAGRILQRAGFDASRGRKEVVVKVRDHGCIVFGEHEIDLSAVDQLLHPAQLRAVAEAMLHAGACFADGNRSLSEVMDLLFDELDREGLSVLARNGEGDLAAFRRHDFAAAVNRLRAPVIKLARQG